MVQDAKSFYFDLALAGTHNVLVLLTRWAPKDRILYGSDFPYCTAEAEYNNDQLEQYQMDSQ
jgi:predicted TIM-barrel fold metal-dependent hydrolase